MKKIVLIGIVAAIALIVGLSGCAMEKTYSYDTGLGFCMEIVTNDSDVQSAAEQSSWKEGVCPSANQLGVCSYTDSTSFSTSVTVNSVYYEGTYYSDAAAAEQACNLISGTWTAQ